jgi:hypothetical protein
MAFNRLQDKSDDDPIALTHVAIRGGDAAIGGRHVPIGGGDMAIACAEMVVASKQMAFDWCLNKLMSEQGTV